MIYLVSAGNLGDASEKNLDKLLHRVNKRRNTHNAAPRNDALAGILPPQRRHQAGASANACGAPAVASEGNIQQHSLNQTPSFHNNDINKNTTALVGDEEDWEDVEEEDDQHEVEKQGKNHAHGGASGRAAGITVNLEADDMDDAAGLLKPPPRQRQTYTKEDREIARLVHRSHLLCLLGRGLLFDAAADDPDLQATLLSLIPASLLTKFNHVSSPNDDIQREALEEIVGWFRGHFKLQKTSSLQPPAENEDEIAAAIAAAAGVKGTSLLLMAVVENRCGTAEELVAVFSAMMRVMGCFARAVRLLEPSSLKPGEALKQEENAMKNFMKKPPSRRQNTASTSINNPTVNVVTQAATELLQKKASLAYGDLREVIAAQLGLADSRAITIGGGSHGGPLSIQLDASKLKRGRKRSRGKSLAATQMAAVAAAVRAVGGGSAGAGDKEEEASSPAPHPTASTSGEASKSRSSGAGGGSSSSRGAAEKKGQKRKNTGAAAVVVEEEEDEDSIIDLTGNDSDLDVGENKKQQQQKEEEVEEEKKKKKKKTSAAAAAGDNACAGGVLLEKVQEKSPSAKRKRKGDAEFERELEVAMTGTAINANKNKNITDLDTDAGNGGGDGIVQEITKKKRGSLGGGGTNGGAGTARGAAFGAHQGHVGRYWIELFCGTTNSGRWVHICPISGWIDRAEDVEGLAPRGQSLAYILAFSGQGGAKDVTRRYTSSFLSAEKQRDGEWWDGTMAVLRAKEMKALHGAAAATAAGGGGGAAQMNLPTTASPTPKFTTTKATTPPLTKSTPPTKRTTTTTTTTKSTAVPSPSLMAAREDRELELRAASERHTHPTTIEGFKKHAVFILARHIAKYQALHPSAKPAGTHKGEQYYLRENVGEIHTAERWKRIGKEVLPEELATPAKRMKKRATPAPGGGGGGGGGRFGGGRFGGGAGQSQAVPPASGGENDNNDDGEGEMSNFYGIWQTQAWVPPAAVGGIVPKNDRGNVEVPPLAAALPAGTVRRYLLIFI